jgi:hypothetical protein
MDFAGDLGVCPKLLLLLYCEPTGEAICMLDCEYRLLSPGGEVTLLMDMRFWEYLLG